MAKYKFIEEVAVDIPNVNESKVWKIGEIIEGEIPDGGGAVVHTEIKTKTGVPVIVSIPLAALEEVSPGIGTKQWFFLGAAAILVLWYVNRGKKPSAIVQTMAGVKKKDEDFSVFKKEYDGFEISEKMFKDGRTISVAVGYDNLFSAESRPNEFQTAYEKVAKMIDSFNREKRKSQK